MLTIFLIVLSSVGIFANDWDHLCVGVNSYEKVPHPTDCLKVCSHLFLSIHLLPHNLESNLVLSMYGWSSSFRNVSNRHGL